MHFLPFHPHTIHFNWKRRQIRDQKGLWITSFFRGMGFALISVFSYIFIYSMGTKYFLQKGEVAGLLFLISYLISLFGTVAVFIIPMANFAIRQIGYRRSIAFSLVLTSTSFLCMSLADISQSLYFIYVASYFQGLGICLYWVTYYTLFSDDAKKETVGSSFGIMDAIAKVGQILAPLLGAAITVVFGFKWLFVFGIVLLLISAAPMLLLKHHLHLDEVSFKEMFKWSKEKRYQKLIIALGGRHIHEKMIQNLWPIYIFIMIGTLEGMAVFQSMIIFASVVFTLLASRMFDKKSDKRIQITGVSGHVLVAIARGFATTLPFIIFIDSFDRLFESMSRTFFFGYLFRRSKGPQSFSFVVYWIFWDCVAVILILLLLILILTIFSIKIFWIAVLAAMALGAAASLLVEDHK